MNTKERITLFLEGGHPIKVYSEEDATILIDRFKKSYKRNLRVGDFIATQVKNYWLVDYVKNKKG